MFSWGFVSSSKCSFVILTTDYHFRKVKPLFFLFHLPMSVESLHHKIGRLCILFAHSNSAKNLTAASLLIILSISVIFHFSRILRSVLKFDSAHELIGGKTAHSVRQSVTCSAVANSPKCSAKRNVGHLSPILSYSTVGPSMFRSQLDQNNRRSPLPPSPNSNFNNLSPLAESYGTGSNHNLSPIKHPMGYLRSRTHDEPLASFSPPYTFQNLLASVSPTAAAAQRTALLHNVPSTVASLSLCGFGLVNLQHES